MAIKTIAIDSLSEQERAQFESRFRAEMRSSGRLQHQHIAALYDAGCDGGTAYIVMELVTGQDLKQRLAAGERFSLAQALTSRCSCWPHWPTPTATTSSTATSNPPT